jgi:hypothetical protein
MYFFVILSGDHGIFPETVVNYSLKIFKYKLKQNGAKIVCWSFPAVWTTKWTKNQRRYFKFYESHAAECFVYSA